MRNWGACPKEPSHLDNSFEHQKTCLNRRITSTPIAQLIERLLPEWEVMSSNPGSTIPKVKNVPAAPLLMLT